MLKTFEELISKTRSFLFLESCSVDWVSFGKVFFSVHRARFQKVEWPGFGIYLLIWRPYGFFLHILSGAFGYSLNWVHFNSLLAQLATPVNRNMRLDNCLAGMQDISAGKRDVPQKSRRVRGNHNNEIGQYYMPINQRARVAPKWPNPEEIVWMGNQARLPKKWNIII